MKTKKPKPEKIDGLSGEDVKRIRTAIRQVWSWSYPRRLCVKRAALPDDFYKCEQCKQVVSKVYPDHIEPVGDVDSGFLARLFCPSSKLQALCKKCHAVKTREERKKQKVELTS